jgi:hypothetical protein
MGEGEPQADSHKEPSSTDLLMIMETESPQSPGQPTPQGRKCSQALVTSALQS